MENYYKNMLQQKLTAKDLRVIKQEIIGGSPIRCSKWEMLWRGMDWQITAESEDYFSAHPEVEKCPFRYEREPIAICPVLSDDRMCNDSVDEVAVCYYDFFKKREKENDNDYV